MIIREGHVDTQKKMYTLKYKQRRLRIKKNIYNKSNMLKKDTDEKKYRILGRGFKFVLSSLLLLSLCLFENKKKRE